MSFKDILSKLDQLSEATKETGKGRIHTAEPGGYGRKDDEDDEGKKVKADAPKRGRGRPKKDADASGEVKTYSNAKGLQDYIVGNKPKSKELDKLPSKKHSLKEYFDQLDRALNEGETKDTATGRVHKGSYGTSYDAGEEGGEKQAAVKRGRGRPKKGADETGEVKKYDFSAFTTKVNAPKTASGRKHTMKEAEQLTIEPAKQNTQVIKQGTKTLGTVSNPQLASQIKQSIGKGEMSLAGSNIGEGEMDESTGDYSATKARAGKDIGKPGKQFAKIAKSAGEKYGSAERGKKVAGAILAKLRGLKEGDLPPQDGLLGAGLGAGRSQGVAESKKVNESMDHRLKAAHHAGKAHALSKQGYNCAYDDMDEARMYHEGFKEGLDECYGQVPIQGSVVADESAQGTVDDMASFGAETPEIADEGNAFTRALAKTPQGGKFSVGGKSFTDRSGYDAKVFESWDNQLGALLEEYQDIQEGLSVSVSKGQQGAPDSVSVTAQDGDADKLLGLIKSAGLGLFGDEGQAEVGVPTGGEQHGGVDVVGDHDGMMALIKKATGGDSDDYADEVGGEEVVQADGGELDVIKQLAQAIGGGSEEGHEEHEEVCGACGSADCECDSEEGEEEVDETETPDQEEFEVAEDNAPDTGEEEVEATDAETAEDNAAASSEGGADDEESDEEEELDESYANADDDGFQADIDFMTKVIAGGLNKQKSTGQTTTPVIAGQKDRMGYSVQESVSDWKKLAGLK